MPIRGMFLPETEPTALPARLDAIKRRDLHLLHIGNIAFGGCPDSCTDSPCDGVALPNQPTRDVPQNSD
jgi:hypothetical protein